MYDHLFKAVQQITSYNVMIHNLKGNLIIIYRSVNFTLIPTGIITYQ